MKKNKIISIVVIVLMPIFLTLGILSMILGKSNAKYVNNTVWNHSIESTSMYIKSNLLNSQGKINYINNYSFNDIELNVYNYISNNQINAFNVEYTLGCSVDADNRSHYRCKIDNGTSIDTIINGSYVCFNGEEKVSYSQNQCEDNNYEWKLEKVKNTHKIKLEKIDDSGSNDVVVTVTLETVNPFKKTLTGTLNININEKNINNSIALSVNQNNESCRYTITNSSHESGKIKLNINTSSLLFDESDKIFMNKESSTSSNGYINSIIFGMGAYESKTINLFRKNVNNSCSLSDVSYQITN